MIRRICFHAGPGAGKSTLAARTFAELKVRGHNVEHIPEYIKTWAYAGRKPTSYDQLYVYAKQLHAEDAALKHVPLVVTDSPLIMNNAYAAFYGCEFVDPMVNMSRRFEKDFPAVNFFIERSVDYVTDGRYQTYEQAIEFDDHLKAFLAKNLPGPLIPVTVDKFDNIMNCIEQFLKGDMECPQNSSTATPSLPRSEPRSRRKSHGWLARHVWPLFSAATTRLARCTSRRSDGPATK